MLARPAEGTPPSNRGLLKRMRKEVERDAALSDSVVHSGDGVAIQFVHEVAEWDDSQTEIVRWAHLWNVADAVGERGPRQLVGVVSLTMGAKYPFRAPDVFVLLPDIDAAAELCTASREETCAAMRADEVQPVELPMLKEWSPACTGAKALVQLATLVAQGVAEGMTPQRALWLPPWWSAAGRLMQRAASVDLLWLSFASGLNKTRGNGALDPRYVGGEKALDGVGGEYYYQHLPTRVQQAALDGKSVFVALVDNHHSDLSEYPGFGSSDQWQAVTGGALKHSTLPIEVQMFAEAWPDDWSTDLAAPTATAVREAAEHAELWVSDFRAECDKTNTALAPMWSARLPPHYKAMVRPSALGYNQFSIIMACQLVENTTGISYLRAADGKLASGLVREDFTPPADAEIEELLSSISFPGSLGADLDLGKRFAPRGLRDAIRVDGWQWL